VSAVLELCDSCQLWHIGRTSGSGSGGDDDDDQGLK